MRSKIEKGLKAVSRRLNHAAAVITRGFFCPCCEKRVTHWKDWSPSYRNVVCPKCGSHPRHRLFALYFKRFAPTLKQASVLHFAPEKPIRRQIAQFAKEYISADLRPVGHPYGLDRQSFLEDQIDVQADVTDMHFAEHRFDVVICSHVLEHVDDDSKALKEIFRVLKYDGWALLQTPFDKCRATTLEHPDIDTPALRLKYYQQEDHVRLFGREIFARFLAAGFMPVIIPPESVCSDPKFFGLWPDEELMIVKKVWTHPASFFEEENRGILAARKAATTQRAAA